MTKVAVLDDYQRVARRFADWDRLDARVDFFHDHVFDRERLVQRLTPYDVIGVMRERTAFDRGLIAGLPNLRLLVTTGRRNAAIDVAAAAEHGVTVCGTTSPGHATAELTFGLILALARGIVTETESVRGGGWQVGVGRDLRGGTLGVIGLGRLGSQVAAMGGAFGMRVVAWSGNLTPERAREVGAEHVPLSTLLATADVVTIHLRLGERSRGLIGAEQLGLMKRDALLVNTARAPIVDTDAVLDALAAGRLGGAAFDVYEDEPLPAEDRLRAHHPNLLTTPHIGYVTRQTYEVFYPEMVEAIEAFLAGRPVRVVDR